MYKDKRLTFLILIYSVSGAGGTVTQNLTTNSLAVSGMYA